MVVYYALIEDLCKDDVFSKAYELVPEYRREKIDRYKVRKGKNESLAAGLLLNYSVQMYQKGISFSELKQVHIDEMISNYDKAYDYEIELGELGKPEFSTEKNIFFNLSHCDRYVVCVVSNKPVGIDVEGNKVVKPEIAKRYFSAEEITFAKDERGFFRIWTLREAYGKYTGEGLFKPLNQVKFICGEGQVICIRNERKLSLNIMEFQLGEYQVAVITDV